MWPKNVITQIIQSLYNFISTLATGENVKNLRAEENRERSRAASRKNKTGFEDFSQLHQEVREVKEAGVNDEEEENDDDDFLGKISHKKSQITIFGHKHKIKNFIKKVIFHKKVSTAFYFGWYLE